MDDVDVYLCDLDPQRIDRARREFNIAVSFASADEVLASDEVDAVDVVLPHHLHRLVAVRAAEAGKHCMVERPIALNLRAKPTRCWMRQTGRARDRLWRRCSLN